MKSINAEVYLKWYKDMLFWRKFEDKCRSLYLKQKIRGFLHLYNGQEAIPAGLIHAINLKTDKVITAYRCHILPIALGSDPKKIMAELCGKATGTSKGLGGSMHIFDKNCNFFGGHGIVASQIPLGAGIAFADKYFGRNGVTVTLMGDGAVRQGALHETFNLSMIWKLPVIFICENNKYAMGTSVERSSNVKDIYQLGSSYNMLSYLIEDGMNPETIAKYVYRAVEYCREGKGPVFIEIKTYRYRGHSISDAAVYRSKEELEKYKNKDPIIRLKKLILNKKLANIYLLDDYEKEVNSKIKKCVKYAENSDFPHPNQIYDFVYKDPCLPFINKIS